MKLPSPLIVVYSKLMYGPGTGSVVPRVEEMPISSPAVQSVSTAREGVLSPIVAEIFTAPEDGLGLSSLLSHEASARMAAAKRSIFFHCDIVFCTELVIYFVYNDGKGTNRYFTKVQIIIYICAIFMKIFLNYR